VSHRIHTRIRASVPAPLAADQPFPAPTLHVPSTLHLPPTQGKGRRETCDGPSSEGTPEILH
jgi:hypothetical protein